MGRARGLFAALVVALVILSACGGSSSTGLSAGRTIEDLSPAWVEALNGESDASPVPAAADEATASPATAQPVAPTATPLPITPSPRPPTTAPVSTVADFPTGIEPRRLTIPAIGVDATTIDLDLRGPAPEVPENFAETGWYTQTRRPGEIGPAVIAGHVDSAAGAAVFHRLDELAVGDQIIVSDADGVTRTFEVASTEQYPKDALPESVFGFGGPQPELRLITCGGTFDRAVGHYRDNLVVFATPVSA